MLKTKEIAETARRTVRNKNPFNKDKYKTITTENDKLLKSLEDIQQGKRLNVASHSVRGGTKKSLNITNKKIETEKQYTENQMLFNNIMNVKSTVPDTKRITERWATKQRYTMLH